MNHYPQGIGAHVLLHTFLDDGSYVECFGPEKHDSAKLYFTPKS